MTIRVRKPFVCRTSSSLVSGALFVILWFLAEPSAAALPDPEVRTALSPPSNVRCLLTDEALMLRWDPAVHAKGYLVRVGTAPGTYDLGSFDAGNETFLGPYERSGIEGSFFVAVQSYADGAESALSDEVAIRLGPANAGRFSLSRALGLLVEDLNGPYSGFGLGSLFLLASAFDPEAFGMLLVRINPQIFFRVPQGLLVEFGEGYAGMDGHYHRGLVVLSYSNTAEDHGTLTGGYSAVVDQVYIDGEFLADGSLSGKFRIALRPDLTLAADLTVEGYFSSSSGMVTVRGRAHFDTSLCRDYPVAGALHAAFRGQRETVFFTGACDGSFGSAAWKTPGGRVPPLP